jgi:endonuclease YncB( thermonuclease family)
VRAKESQSRLAFDRQLQAYCHKKNRYGRAICKVMRGGIDVNLEQLRAGMAWHYREYAREQSVEDRLTYAAAETEAREARRGLWKDSAPVPPWEWRKGQR